MTTAAQNLVSAQNASNRAFNAAIDRAIAKGLRARTDIATFVDAQPEVIAARAAVDVAKAQEAAARAADGQAAELEAQAASIGREYRHDVSDDAAHTEGSDDIRVIR